LPDLIPRELLFGNPDVEQVLLSPDGRWISYIAASEGVLNVWLAPFGKLAEAEPLTRDRKRGVRYYGWTWDSRYLYYIQDEGGDENWHIHAVAIADGQDRDLTPFAKTNAYVAGLSPDHPGKMLVGLNTRDSRYHDHFLLDVASGDLAEVFRNEEGYLDSIVDFDLKLRLVRKFEPDGGVTYYDVLPSGEIKAFLKLSQEDTTVSGALGINRAGDVLYFQDSTGRDTAALYRYDLKKGTRELVLADDRVDVTKIQRHPLSGELEATSICFERQDWIVHAPERQADFDLLRAGLRGDFGVKCRTLADDKWIVEAVSDDNPSQYYLYDRGAKKLELLLVQRKALQGKALARSRPVMIAARDGLQLLSYLTLPHREKGALPAQPLPMVLLVHGGPWMRDYWGFGSTHQLLADRGYAVLSVNFRGSTGFGKNFVNAGNREWGRKMHDDLVDAVQWAVREKAADPARIGIMGGSYGGYATLAGLAFTPGLFACGVDIVGPSNLITLIASTPDYWAAALLSLYAKLGDPRTPEGRQMLEARSPLNSADKITKPLLIGQGANDPRVKQAEADQIANALKGKGIPVTYALYPDEGHGFARPENNLSFMAVTEAFLKQHLGGAAEPIGKAFEGSSIQILEGKEGIPGL
jgi:dipeptidyl aminopeptidase/acylaminoacyl peptidase